LRRRRGNHPHIGSASTGALAPQLWPIEALNGLLTAERRSQTDRGLRQRLAGFLQESPIKIDDETASGS
jgi:hypothetical protein